jgi:hypothetical protein
MRREAIKAATTQDKQILCAICCKKWPVWAADVDHTPRLGSLNSLEELGSWAHRLFYGPVRVLDKTCHKKVTAEQRRKKQ